MTNPTYDTIGIRYAEMRRPDPRIAQMVRDALGTARTVVNIGAGTGNYEPVDLEVTAVEPSQRMIDQRPPDAGKAVRAYAEDLPFHDHEFDASLAMFTVHHWTDWEKGLSEMRRVAPRQVIVFCDPDESSNYWLADYFPEMLELPSQTESPTIAEVSQHLDVEEVTPIEVPADCIDGFIGAYWKRPTAYLDEAVRASMSPLAQLQPEELSRGVHELARDLADGTWEDRYRHLLDLQSLDVGYRLIIAGE